MAEWFHQLGPQDFRLVGPLGFGPWATQLALRWFAREKDSCFPSIGSISEMLDVPPRTIQYHLAQLESAGMIHREVQRGKPTKYHLLGTATSCTPSDSRDAISCTTPTQDLASGGTKSCAKPTQDLAHKEKKLKETLTNEVKRTKRGCAAEVVFPSELSSDLFKEAWERWLSYRRKRRFSCLPECLEGQLKKLAALGQAGAVEEINNAITNTWQSVCYKTGARNGKRCIALSPSQRHPEDIHTTDGDL